MPLMAKAWPTTVRRMRVTQLLLVCALIAGGAAACGDDDGGGGGGNGGGNGEAAGVDDPSSFEALLSELPADVEGSGEDPPGIQIADYAGAAEALGIEIPDAGADEEALADYFRALSIGDDEQPGAGVAVSAFTARTAIEDAEWRAEVGWAPVDVEQAVEVQGSESIHVFHGDFDPEAIDEAVRSDPNWSDQLEVAEHEGTEFYTWGEDNAPSENITTVRPVGRGGRMAVLGNDTIVWTEATEPMTDTLDAISGDAESLADDPELAAVAGALDGADTVSGYLLPGPLAVGFDIDSSFDPTIPAGLQPYEAVGTGTAIADEGNQVLLAFHHADESAAEANAEAIEDALDGGTSVDGAPWPELVELASTDLDGGDLLVTLDLVDEEQVNLWVQMVFQREPLLAVG